MDRIITAKDNAPPDPLDDALAPFCDAISEAEGWLDGAPVETEAQMKAVDALLAEVKAAEKAVAAADESATKPLYDAWKREKARFKPTIDDLARIRKGLIALVDGFKRRLAAEKEAAKREAQRAAWQAAEEARRAAETANVADIASQREAAEKQAAFEAAQAAAKAAEADTVRGLRSYDVVEIVDATAFARWLWANDRHALEVWMLDYARRHALHIPGVVETRKEKRAV